MRCNRTLLLLIFLGFGGWLNPVAGNIFTPNPATPLSADMQLSQDGPLGVRLVAPRNGFATAPVVVRGASREITARLNQLAHQSGRFNLDSSHITINYGLNALHSEPRRDGDWQVVWVTVQVPPNALPGVYRGEVQGLPQAVPVQLEVGDWLAPRPNDFRILSGFIQSPETVALHSGVTMWSNDHFELLEKHLQLLGQLGNDTLFLPVVGRTHLTYDYPLLRFTGSAGNFRPEFSVVERYLELWNKHVGPPRYVILYMLRDPGVIGEEVQISHVSSASSTGGTLREAPAYGASGSVEMWRPAVQGIQQRMTALGWERSELLFGVIHDGRNFSSTFHDFFSAIGPDVAWSTFTHGRGDPSLPWDEIHVVREVRFSHVEFPYDPPGSGIVLTEKPNWHRKVGFTTTHRNHFVRTQLNDGAAFRHIASRAVVSSGSNREYGGFGRIGLDYWSVDVRGGNRPIIGMADRQNNLYRNNPRAIIAPGRDGPLATHAFTMAREGLAEAEAFALLQEALYGRKIRGSLREEATEVGERFVDLVRRDRASRDGSILSGEDWQGVLIDLLNVAGKVAREIGAVAELPEAGSAASVFREDQARSWTSADGRQIEAQFLGYDGTQVTLLLPDNREARVPLDRLSSNDRSWVRAETGYRIWRDQQGREIEARKIAATADTVTIAMPNGQEFEVPIQTLSSDDRDFIRNSAN